MMSAINEKKRKIAHDANSEDFNSRIQQQQQNKHGAQNNHSKKEEQSKKIKKMKSKKQPEEEVPDAVSDKTDSNLDLAENAENEDFSQGLNSTSSDEENEEKSNSTDDSETKRINETCIASLKGNINESDENVNQKQLLFENNKNQLSETESNAREEMISCNETSTEPNRLETVNNNNLEQIRQQLNENELNIHHHHHHHNRNLTVGTKDDAANDNENCKNLISVQHNSLSKSCDIINSNNFVTVSNKNDSDSGIVNTIINSTINSSVPPSADSDNCVLNEKFNNNSITENDALNLRRNDAENLSQQTDVEQEISSASSIWQNTHNYGNVGVNRTECYEPPNVKEQRQASEARKSEENEFQQEYNRLQNEDIMNKMKNEEDHMRPPESQQEQQMIDQPVFTNAQHQEANYNNLVHTQQHGEHQVPGYGMMYNEMSQRSQQQPPPHPHQYSHEQQFYQMRLQQQQQQQQQHASLLTQQQQNLNLQDALQDEQLLAYLHPQQQQQQPNRTQHDAYGDLVMDEFHDEGNANVSANLYKLQLSPAAKHENQDDGYETSAGDVLTPNSHSSSTQSGTPQSVTVSQHAPSTSALALHNITQSQQHLHHKGLQPQGHMQAPLPANSLIDSFSPRTTPCITNDDPYKFHDEPPLSNAANEPKDEHAFCMPLDQQLIHNSTTTNSSIPNQMSEMPLGGKPPQKRRGRKKKVDSITENIEGNLTEPTGDNPLAPPGLVKVKERKKHDRFNGMSEEEVMKRTLPDHLCHNLDIVIIGINPGLFAAYKGHHYAGPGNHFWKCLYLSGLTQEQMSADEDFKLMKYGIGFTNMVQRATKGSADLTRKEIKEGSRVLLEKLQTFQPKIAVFNGKLIFEVFSGKKDFHFGRQPDCVEGTNTFVWVMPSSSARCAQLPRAADKVPFYAALKKFRDFLNGIVPHIDEAECVFSDQRIREMCEQEQAKNLAQSQQQNNATAGTDQQNDYALFGSSDSNQINSSNLNPNENTNGGPGPPSMTGNRTGYFQQQPEKKKRGRPKKLKIQEIIDPNTGERIQISNQHQTVNDYSNILNLSMVAGETPKKKRGRPKKMKMLTGNGNESGGGGDGATSSSRNPQTTLSLFSNSPQNVNVQQLSGYGSPISPSIHNSTTFNNMVMGGTPPKNSNEMPTDSDVISNNNKHQHMQIPSTTSPQPSLPPGSPNICAVDFEPPSTAVDHNSTEHDLAKALQHQVHRNNHFQQWMPTTPQQQFNYSTDEQQLQYQREHNLSMQLHQSQQGSPHTPWASAAQQSFETTTSENNQRQTQQQQQQHHHYIMNSSHQNQQQQQQQQQHTLHHQQNIEQQQQQQQQPTDVAAKSLSGLESLVDQIPTIAESEAAAAAAVESRLQALQRDSTPVSLGELQAESVFEARGLTEVTGTESRNSNSSNGGSNTPQHYGVNANSGGGGPSSCSSPTISHHIFSNSNNLQRHHSSQASSAASSPHAQQYAGTAASVNFAAATDHSAGSDMLVGAAQTPPMITSSAVTTNSTTSATTSHVFSNFSVSHLAASSCNANSNSNISKSSSDWPSNAASAATASATAGSPYHHSNLMAAAAIQLTTSPHHQMYIDHHTSIHPHHAAAHLHPSSHQHHLQMNSFYPPAAQAHHHHPGMAVSAYGPPSSTSQHGHHPHAHNASSEYGTYGATPAHLIHMPSPNYPPYGYGTPPPPTGAVTTQSNYSSWNHHHHHSHHHPSTVPSHHSHHLSMFERLKPSDIGSYTGF